nr:MAG TPA: hypothetical protein [Caudoviricetes sp.]
MSRAVYAAAAVQFCWWPLMEIRPSGIVTLHPRWLDHISLPR